LLVKEKDFFNIYKTRMFKDIVIL